MSWRFRGLRAAPVVVAWRVPATEFATQYGSVLRAKEIPSGFAGQIKIAYHANSADAGNTGTAGGNVAWGFCTGRGKIAGTVKANGIAVSRPVYLHHARSMRFVWSAQSAAGTGAYLFEHIDETQEYVVLARDDAGRLYNVTGADFVVPIPM